MKVISLLLVGRVYSRSSVAGLCARKSAKAIMSGFGEVDFGTVPSEISNIRKPYYPPTVTFTEDKLFSKDPIKQFEEWFRVASANADIPEPNAVTLATADKEGKPSARMVLLKGFGQDGFRFFTNYSSRKAHDLACNAHAALVLYWGPINRSVRVEGTVEKLSDEDNDKYFATRPRRSQIAAHVSEFQSSPVDSRETLLKLEKQIAEKYSGSEIPRPDFWGGYVVKPHTIEFWQGQSNRLHDRFIFRKKKPDDIINEKTHMKEGKNGWLYQRFFP